MKEALKSSQLLHLQICGEIFVTGRLRLGTYCSEDTRQEELKSGH